jgi:hypothetical protein
LHLLDLLVPVVGPVRRVVPDDGEAGAPPQGRAARRPDLDHHDQAAAAPITCGGSYDHATGHYRDNLIVYASPTGN